MTDLPAARRLLKDAPDTCHGVVVLAYDERLVRRKRLVTVQDEGFMVDLPEVTNLDLYWGFELVDGRAVQVTAAEEPVLAVTGPDLARYAWHIGNRHTPCAVEAQRLVIRADHVLDAMLRQLGATVAAGHEPFSPELGAYGVGRPMGHGLGSHGLGSHGLGSHGHGSHGHGGHDHGGHDPGKPHVHHNHPHHDHDDDEPEADPL
jgi:urease accessory protein